MKASDISSNEYAPYYANYVKQAGSLELIPGLKASHSDALAFYRTLTETQFNHSYAQGKWTIKELLQHVIDAERVFAYRAMRIARKDKVNLPGFSQDDFVVSSNANSRTPSQLIADYDAVRGSTITLFESFTAEMLMEIGQASDVAVSCRAIGFIILGHEAHHIKIVKERYL